MRLSTGERLATSGERWREAVQERARVAAESEDGTVLCLGTHADVLEIWDVVLDRPLSRTTLEGLTEVRVLPGACRLRGTAAASPAGFYWLDPTGPPHVLGIEEGRGSAL